MTTTHPEPLLSLEHAQKSFGAVHALEDGDIELFGGEVHGLVGENGAGKSTLVKILAGVHRPDGGRLVLDGEDAIFDNAKQSQAAGIAIIFQEPTLFPDLSVAENIFVGMQPLKRLRRIDGRRMRREAAAVFEQLGVRLATHSSAVDATEALEGLHADEDVLSDAQVGEERRLLEDDRDPCGLRLFRVVEDRFFAVEYESAGFEPVDAGEDLDERGLPGAVLADEAVHLAAEELDVAVHERVHGAEALLGVLEGENRRGIWGHCSSMSGAPQCGAPVHH